MSRFAHHVHADLCAYAVHAAHVRVASHNVPPCRLAVRFAQKRSTIWPAPADLDRRR